MRELDWRGCYRDNLTGKIHPDAFAHPAKMAWGLARRIFEHLFERGWLKKGDLVADPFGGIGVTGLMAASFGCPCILVELEQKFVDLANKSLELHYDAWDKMARPRPIILQGDSRNFSSIIREAVDSIVTSPPFQQALKGGGIMKDGYASPQRPDLPPDQIATRTYAEGQIGAAEGQIGAMKEGKLDEVVAVITSPPYAESLQPETEEQTRRKQERIAKAKTIHNGRASEKPSPGKAALGGGYGVSEGQLGAMKEGKLDEAIAGIVTSAPFLDARSNTTRSTPAKSSGPVVGRFATVAPGTRYGDAEGQIGDMAEGNHEAVVNGIVTSPPYAIDPKNICHTKEGKTLQDYDEARGYKPQARGRMGYSPRPDNLGNLPEGNHEAVVNGVVTSPPYERSMDSSENAEARAERANGFTQGMKTLRYGEDPYGFLSKDPSGVSNEERHRLAAQNPQIGQKQGDTYWEAVSQVYQECFKALRLGGIICVVVKDFVRQGQRVPLCDQTFELLQAVGFKPLERIRAWMVRSEYKDTLFDDDTERYFYKQSELKRRKAWEAGGKHTRYKPLDFDAWLLSWKQRKKASFFRRLTELRGSPRIDWEEVLICQKVD